MSNNLQFKTAAGQPSFATEVCTEAYAPLFPQTQNRTAIIYRERFTQLRTYYTRPAYNTPHPYLPQVYFADDTDFQDRPGNVVEWTRVYSTLPPSWNDFESYAYSFPGYQGLRAPFTRTVTAKLTRDYFIAGTLPTFQNNLASSDPGGAGWTTSGLTVSANATANPLCAGGNTNGTVLQASGSGEHWAFGSSNLGAGNAAGSIFLKAGTCNRAYVVLYAGANIAISLVDLETGNFDQSVGSGGTVQAISDGWWRVGLSGVAGNANAAIVVYLANATNQTVFSGLQYLSAWRAQVSDNMAIHHSTIPPTQTADSTNYPVQSADLIPVKFGQLYLYNWSGNIAAEFLSGATSPTLTNYQANVNIDQNSANPNIYSIEATDSTLSLWQGTIWERVRTFVKAR
jgi:hypothetical protein